MDNDYVEGLTGEEIINDVLDQLESKLKGDCNLRGSDAYPGGYSGVIEVHLNLHGLDKAEVKTKIVVGAPADDPNIQTVDTQVDAHLEIPLEPKLNLVRERSGQDIPTLAKDEEGRTVVKKRHYARSQK